LRCCRPGNRAEDGDGDDATLHRVPLFRSTRY
jgi:hypothetical protein